MLVATLLSLCISLKKTATSLKFLLNIFQQLEIKIPESNPKNLQSNIFFLLNYFFDYLGCCFFLILINFNFASWVKLE